MTRSRYQPANQRLRSVLPERRIRPLRIVLLMCLLVAGVLGVQEAEFYLAENEVLTVKHIAIENLSGEFLDEVEEYAQIEKGTPLFDVAVHEIAKRVSMHPFVQSAEVSLRVPDTVVIDVLERRAVAVLALERLYLIDEEGFPFKRAVPGDGLDLPLLTGFSASDFKAIHRGEQIERALEILKIHSQTNFPGGKVSQLHFLPQTGFSLVLEGGLQVELPRHNVEYVHGQMREVLRSLKSKGKEAEWIFLRGGRFPDRVAVRFKNMGETPSKPGT